jgi:signal transduction histidine kinase
MEPGGRVTVSVEATTAEVVLRVRDTGIRIAPEVLGLWPREPSLAYTFEYSL